MKERIEYIKKSDRPEKKYVASVKDKKGHSRLIHFGAKDYEQYRDSALGLYSSKNHGDSKRRKAYFLRHSGTDSKRLAIEREKRKSHGLYNAKILSHQYLW